MVRTEHPSELTVLFIFLDLHRSSNPASAGQGRNEEILPSSWLKNLRDQLVGTYPPITTTYQCFMSADSSFTYTSSNAPGLSDIERRNPSFSGIIVLHAIQSE
jgi:hypothetical protein